MKPSSVLLVVLALTIIVASTDASRRRTKDHKHGGRSGPGGRSRHHPHHDTRNDHGYDYHRDHGRNHHHHDHHQKHGNWHYRGSHERHNGHDQHDFHYRHRRDIINGTEENDTMTTLEPGTCTKLVSVTVTFAQSFQKSRKVPKIIKCGWLHLAKCKVYRLEYETAYRQATRVQYAIVRKCCPGFMEIDGVCVPIGDRTTPPPTTPTTTPMQTTTAMMTTTDVPDDYMMMIDDKIQKIVSAVIIILLLLFTGCCIGGCIVYVCKCCHGKKGSYV